MASAPRTVLTARVNTAREAHPAAAARPINHSYGHRKLGVDPSESEMRDQHPAPPPSEGASHVSRRNSPRQRAHRGHHELHEHVESQRHARRRFAREEGGGARTQRESHRQGVARARLARGERLPEPRPACSRTSTSSASTWSAMAARRASAIPARCRPRSKTRMANTISSRPRCFPATATSRRACIRASRRTSSCRRRWSSPSRWRAAWTLT
jgi:hypothetical protein